MRGIGASFARERRHVTRIRIGKLYNWKLIKGVKRIKTIELAVIEHTYKQNPFAKKWEKDTRTRNVQISVHASQKTTLLKTASSNIENAGLKHES